MSEFVGGLILLVSLVFIGHAGLSAVEHLSFVKATHVGESSLPLDIVLEVLVGLLLSIFGAVLYAGEFQEVKMEKEISKRTIDILGMTPSFRSVRHRGSRLFKD
ncbi:UNVERIFIED_CONTAM: Membrane magnesium transporter 1 [Siphonaria sp. JEL0065]|nr:Membrane magnesium transporter 1 [Siphonaria sp. JEL0065]